MNADIKNHGDKIRPPEKKKRPKPVPMMDEAEAAIYNEDVGKVRESGYTPMEIRESHPDPFGLLDNDPSIPEAIPGLFKHQSAPDPNKKRRKSKTKQKKADELDDSANRPANTIQVAGLQ